MRPGRPVLDDGACGLRGVMDNTLWRRIPAVRDDDLCPISPDALSAWFDTAPLAIEVVLDDVERCLR